MPPAATVRHQAAPAAHRGNVIAAGCAGAPAGKRQGRFTAETAEHAEGKAEWNAKDAKSAKERRG